MDKTVAYNGMIKISIIKKLPNGKYRLYSRKKGPDGNRKNLGTYNSSAAAKKRERAIQYFKHHADDGSADDKQTKALRDLSNIALYLEEAGFVDRANEVYAVMDLIDGSMEDNLNDSIMSSVPDAQRNITNEHYLGGDAVGGGYSTFNIQEGQPADDSIKELNAVIYAGKIEGRGTLSYDNGMWKLILKRQYDTDINVAPSREQLDAKYNRFGGKIYVQTDLDLKHSLTGKPMGFFIKDEPGSWHPITFLSEEYLLDQMGVKKRDEEPDDEQDNIDAITRSNGLQGNSVTDNQNAGSFQGFSDSYFYRGYGNLEGIYGPGGSNIT